MRYFALLFLPLLLSSSKIHPIASKRIPQAQLSQDLCQICWKAINNKIQRINYCTHTFHPDCINLWLKTIGNCPICGAYNNKPRAKTTSNNEIQFLVLITSTPLKTRQFDILLRHCLMHCKKITAGIAAMKQALANTYWLLLNSTANLSYIAQAEELLDDVSATMDNVTIIPFHRELSSIHSIATNTSDTIEARSTHIHCSKRILDNIEIDLNDQLKRIKQAKILLTS